MYHGPLSGYCAHHLLVQSKFSRRLDCFFYKSVSSFIILNHGRFHYKTFTAFPPMHDDTLIVNKRVRLLISILPQVCRIFFSSDYTQNFDMSDLTPLFNWNTKQLFLYLEAEYDNTKGVSRSPLTH